jgi:glyoxylase-like metal-dependent hydrolase (beta-lactamase superfamily II)
MTIREAIGAALALAVLAGPAAGQSAPSTGLTTYHVQGNVWVIAGAGGNITVQASSAAAAGPGAGEGVLLVDTGRKDTTSAVLAEIQKISPKRIEYIVTTHVDADHVGGHETFAKPRMDYLWTPGMVTGAGVKVIAHENVLPRMSNGPSAYARDRVAHQHLLLGAAEDLVQRRTGSDHPRAGGEHRRRQPGVLPRLGRDQRR